MIPQPCHRPAIWRHFKVPKSGSQTGSRLGDFRVFGNSLDQPNCSFTDFCRKFVQFVCLRPILSRSRASAKPGAVQSWKFSPLPQVIRPERRASYPSQALRKGDGAGGLLAVCCRTSGLNGGRAAFPVIRISGRNARVYLIKIWTGKWTRKRPHSGSMMLSYSGFEKHSFGKHHPLPTYNVKNEKI